MHEEDLLLVQEEDLLLVQEEDVLLVQGEDLLLDLLLTQEEDKEWLPEKLKMVKKSIFPELSGDLWGVICYHHWYLRAGLEGQKNNSFQTKFLGLIWCRITP